MLKSIEADLAMIKKDLAEQGKIYGAYYREYGSFREIYRFVARGLSRSGQTVYILLCSLFDGQGEVPEQALLEPAMVELQELIRRSLRRGDLFAQYSSAQYIIMLPGTAYENSGMVVERILSAYELLGNQRNLQLYCSREPMTPII